MTAAATDPDLRLLQLTFWKLITAPEGVRPGIADLVRTGELTETTVPEWIEGDERLDAAGRLDIYANMYFFRLLGVLSQEFEKTAGLLGEARFHNLITDFLLVHPPTQPSLRYLGHPLPGYIATHAEGRERPYLSELALVEWAHNDVFQTVNTPILTRAELAAVPPERWGELVLRPIAAMRLLDLTWDIDALWDRLSDKQAALSGQDAAEPVERKSQAMLVYRQDDRDWHIVITPKDRAALEALLAGKTFADICESIAEGDDLEAAAGEAAGMLAGWLDREILSGYELAG